MEVLTALSAEKKMDEVDVIGSQHCLQFCDMFQGIIFASLFQEMLFKIPFDGFILRAK
jgi:hypothetical protein